jgi:hypothetical protein
MVILLESTLSLVVPEREITSNARNASTIKPTAIGISFLRGIPLFSIFRSKVNLRIKTFNRPFAALYQDAKSAKGLFIFQDLKKIKILKRKCLEKRSLFISEAAFAIGFCFLIT